jgi:hypothetical protein
VLDGSTKPHDGPVRQRAQLETMTAATAIGDGDG